MADEATVDAVEQLLSGSRGRRLCLEYARQVSAEASAAIGWLALDLDRGGVAHRVILSSTSLSPADEARAAAAIPRPSAEGVASLIAAIEPGPVFEPALRAAFGACVDSARYWQEPDGEDRAAAAPAILAALRGVAAALVGSDLARNWDAARTPAQWAVDWRVAADASPLERNPSGRLAEWDRAQREDEERARVERPRDPHANWSGCWWSVPQTVLQTRGRVADALELVEDAFSWEWATVIPVRGSGRTLEIRSTHAWAELCRRYPVEVTASRRHDWFRVTGRDGRWLIPDWPRVAEDWDAVHLTTLGYLRAAETLIEIDGEYASVLAGWPPDCTLWLTDAAREWDGGRQEWMRPPSERLWIRRA